MFSDVRTQKFLLSLTLVLIVSIFILQVPGLLLLLSDFTSPSEISTQLRAMGRIGANKEFIFLMTLAIATAVTFYLATVSRVSRGISIRVRFFSFTFALLILGSYSMSLRQARFFNERQHDALALHAIAYERLVIQQMRSATGIEETQKLILSDPPNDFLSLHDLIEQDFSRNLNPLKKTWNGLEGDALKALYTMNVVSRLWAFGNESHPDQVGCALQNEQTDFKAQAFDGVQTFIRSPIGCCSDYAYTLKKMLDLSKVENRLVEIPGHVFNEARIDGQWWTLDATTNMAIPQAWSSLVAERPPNKVKVFTFPHWNLRAQTTQDYRSKVGVFRLYFLNLVSLGDLKDFRYENEIPAGMFPKLP